MTSSFLFDFQNFKLEDAAKRSDFFLQKKTALQNEGKAELMLMIIAALIGKASFFLHGFQKDSRRTPEGTGGPSGRTAGLTKPLSFRLNRRRARTHAASMPMGRLAATAHPETQRLSRRASISTSVSCQKCITGLRIRIFQTLLQLPVFLKNSKTWRPHRSFDRPPPRRDIRSTDDSPAKICSTTPPSGSCSTPCKRIACAERWTAFPDTTARPPGG